jgi:hypothetical protein
MRLAHREDAMAIEQMAVSASADVERRRRRGEELIERKRQRT